MNMTPVSFAILIVLSMVGLWIFVTLGSLPGKTATERNHPQAEAINILGWLGLLFGGMGWMVAMVWARMKPIFPPAVAETTAPAAAGESDAPTQEAS